jgi:hypothetical protein
VFDAKGVPVNEDIFRKWKIHAVSNDVGLVPKMIEKASFFLECSITEKQQFVISIGSDNDKFTDFKFLALIKKQDTDPTKQGVTDVDKASDCPTNYKVVPSTPMSLTSSHENLTSPPSSSSSSIFTKSK